MARICVVADSSTALMPKDAEKLGIVLAPLNVIIDGKSGIDLFEVTPQEVEDALRAGKDVSTSQPNLGYLEDAFKKIKEENYDHIFVYALPAYLSGTFNALQLAANNNDIKNISFYDTKSAAGVIKHVAIRATELAKEGKSVEEIQAYSKAAFQHSITYILPESLDQLRKNGRVKGAVAALSNLLKIKLCVYIAWETEAIEKFATERVEKKLWTLVYEDMLKRGYNSNDYKIYLPDCDGKDHVEDFKKFFAEKEPNATVEEMPLPAGIAAHVGLGTLGVQMVLKG